jgi:hypothetical protein
MEIESTIYLLDSLSNTIHLQHKSTASAAFCVHLLLLILITSSRAISCSYNIFPAHNYGRRNHPMSSTAFLPLAFEAFFLAINRYQPTTSLGREK